MFDDFFFQFRWFLEVPNFGSILEHKLNKSPSSPYVPIRSDGPGLTDCKSIAEQQRQNEVEQ